MGKKSGECIIHLLFLEEREDTIHTLGYGFPEQEEMVYRVLTHVELERFIDCICRLKPKDHFEKSDVPVFSDFQKPQYVYQNSWNFHLMVLDLTHWATS